jgi:hypothetical protein
MEDLDMSRANNRPNFVMHHQSHELKKKIFGSSVISYMHFLHMGDPKAFMNCWGSSEVKRKKKFLMRRRVLFIDRI